MYSKKCSLKDLTTVDYPFVSIIIPVKNEEKYVNKCLNVVTKLDYPQDRYEIIVVDNNSSDNTKEVVKEFDNVILLEKKEGTIGAVRNFGAKKAKGEILAFLDGDCIPDRKWLSLGCDYLTLNDNVSCIGFAVSKPSQQASWIERTWYNMSSGSKYQGICDVRWLSSFNLILEKKYFKEVGGFDESLETCEDADLGYKLNRISKLIYSDEIKIDHLGSAKTIKEIFLKELWRGKGNWNSFLNNKNKIKNSPSVFIPVGYVLLMLFLTVLIFLHFTGLKYKAVVILVAVILIALPIVLALFKQNSFNVIGIARMAILYFIYLIARGLAVFRFT